MRIERSSRVFAALVLPLFLAQTACESRRAPSFLIVAVDSLPFSLSVCTRESGANSGFRRLCNESIRFTHATAPSVLTVPALTSLLTGRHPADHGIRHNGGPGLAPRFSTFGEAALRRGRRTAFFSGGAPVWRRTGLHQGFEIFDDGIGFANGRLFRNLSENTALFRQWLEGEVGDDAFAAVIYAPDLSFTDTVTEAENGELRGLNEDSQLEELDESLGALFDALDEGKRWNDTVIVVAGLNGREISPRPRDIEPMLLNSENTQVSLFVKPAGKPRDEALHWKVDRTVSLTDVGYTLFELLHAPPPAERGKFGSVSLASALSSAQPDWLEDRLIPVESGWAAWQGWGPVRMGAVVGHDLVIDDETPLVFNTLVDRLETAPQRLNPAAKAVLGQLEAAGSVPWPGLPPEKRALFRIHRLDWMIPARAAALHRELKDLTRGKDPDPRALRWAAQLATEQRDWETLAALGKKAGKPLWTAVAERNLGKKTALGDPCLVLFEGKKSEHDRKSCGDENLLALLAYVRGEGEADFARRRFARTWDAHQMDLRILKANAALGLLWLPVSAEESLPRPLTLALALPELKRLTP